MGTLMNASDASAYLAEFWQLSDTQKQHVLNQLRTRGFSDEELTQLFADSPIISELDPEVIYMIYPEYRLHKLLLLYVSPFLVVLGTIGNLFSFFILRHKSMRQLSITVYLSTLAVFDSLVLYIGLLRQWVGELTGTDPRSQNSWLCKGVMMFGYTCSDVSVWLIIAVTVERYIAVCHPLRVPHYCQELKARKIVVGIILVFILINFHFFFSVDVRVGDSAGSKQVLKCAPLPGYEDLVSLVWPWIDAILYGFGPFVLISGLNSAILIKICRANRSRARLLNGQRSNTSHTNSSLKTGNTRMVIMLLTISFTFLLTTVPMNISTIMANIWINTPSSSNSTRSKGILFGTSATLLMYLNHSINFFLYCATGKKFRQVVLRIFCKKTRLRSAPELDHSQHLFCSRKSTGFIRYASENQKSTRGDQTQV